MRLNGAKSLPNHAGEELLNDIKTIHSHQQLPAVIPAASHPYTTYPRSTN